MLYKQYQDIRYLLLESREDLPEQATDVPLDFLSIIESSGSSVVCTGDDHSTRRCKFRNLCYLPDEDHFLFFHGQSTILEGLPEDRFNPALLDFSSVKNHNTQYFNYIDVPSESARSILGRPTVISTRSLLFRRFNPSNIMHAFHDDLLPMFHTLRLITLHDSTTMPFDVQIVFMDNADHGSFSHLYGLYSSSRPITKRDIQDAGETICFREAHVGLDKSMTWYQYGFFEPQGPLPDIHVTSSHIAHFANFTRHRLNLTNQASPSTKIAVILSRKHNRLILNELSLSSNLAQQFNLKVVLVSLETHTAAEIIETIGQADLLVGMHGSLFIMSLFLPPGSVLLELFPYGVNPKHYTPYKTLANIQRITYHSWRNLNKDHAVPHPYRPRELGGIAHLDADLQGQITNSVEVPRHLCCRDPEWLFRIYQDTIVDIDAVISIIRSSPSETKPPLPPSVIMPSLVLDIHCDISAHSLRLGFTEPWNLELLDARLVQYEVWIQDVDSQVTSAWVLTRTFHDFALDSDSERRVWVRCVLDETLRGPFNQDPVLCNE
ncbi:hypothetical protein CAPTEDRAFT_132480 [Capitella teleta]|uniref:Glycosyltransferase 61 catalytic domain-containing protein n=1 Tax=Capitella teleta TaxID=283909 RepID=R7V8G6_CAPTE|nr:hypothetical protein CAPTEDRAFT_132480 [Capitella teleta]|eukprot:ELU14792.1 hypothetical protein CAPTEDRAFT_132480 [Capitella teleta]